MKKKRDAVFACFVIMAALAGMGLTALMQKKEGKEVLVMGRGEVLGRYWIREDRDLTFQDVSGRGNHLVIRDGKVWMEAADCPDQICVSHRPISEQGEMIVCLPQQLTVEIVTGTEGELDVIVQ